MDPVRAEIEWHAEHAGIGDAAAADMVGGLDQYELPPGGGEPARGGNPRGTCADDYDVGRGRARAAGSERNRWRRQRGRSGKERAAAHSRHGFQILAASADCPNARAARKR